MKAGIVEPAKTPGRGCRVTRPALQNAASTAAPFPTTEVLVIEKP